MKTFMIGIDIGTQGSKAALYSADGRCLATGFAASKLRQPGKGIVEEDPEYQLETVIQTIKTCVSESKIDPGGVAAIAIDGQMAGVIGIGTDGKAVTPYDSWLDTRCEPYIKQMQCEAGERIISRTGCAPSYNHGPKILWWKHERGDVYAGIKAFVQPGGYAAMRLCGLDARSAFIDASYLHFSGFADNQRSCWDEQLCEGFGVDPAILPEIKRSDDIIGQLAETSARACGLVPGIPVVAGCGDTAASFLACGAVSAGVCVDVAGTASVFAATTGEFNPDVQHATLGVGQAVAPGLWHPYAYINGGGMNLEWFRKELLRIPGTGSGISFEDLNRMAGEIEPEPTLPMFVPHLAGRVSPAWPDIRGAWAGLTWNHSAAHLYRAALEGVALEYGIYQEILNELDSGFMPAEIRVTGGGEKSVRWNQMKADILGVPVVQMKENEGAPKGSAMLAGYGAGVFKDLKKTADSWCVSGQHFMPDKKRRSFYDERLRRYKSLLIHINEWHKGE